MTRSRPPRRPVPDDVRAGLDSGRYVATAAAVARLGNGVTPDRLRDWLRRPNVPVDVVRHPDGEPCRVPGRRGLENVWVWDQLPPVEERLRTSGRGRPRKRLRPAV